MTDKAAAEEYAKKLFGENDVNIKKISNETGIGNWRDLRDMLLTKKGDMDNRYDELKNDNDAQKTNGNAPQSFTMFGFGGKRNRKNRKTKGYKKSKKSRKTKRRTRKH